jgi:hypothetical protein
MFPVGLTERMIEMTPITEPSRFDTPDLRI